MEGRMMGWVVTGLVVGYFAGTYLVGLYLKLAGAIPRW